MAKVLLAIVAGLNHKKRFMRQMAEFEQQGYTVHLFEEENWQAIYLNSLQGAVQYLNEQEAVESIALLCNNQPLLFAWYRQHENFFSEYFLYVDEPVKNGLQQLVQDRGVITELNEFSDIDANSTVKPVQVIFSDWEHILWLVAHYLAFVEPYGGRLAKPPASEKAAAWDNVFASRAVDYGMKKHRIPQDVARLLFLPFFQHTVNRPDLACALLTNAVAALKALNTASRKKARAFLEGLLAWFTPQCRASLYSLLYRAYQNKQYIRTLLSTEMAEQLEHRERSGIFWTILRLSFVGKLSLSFEDNVLLRNFYQTHVAKAAAAVRIPTERPLQMRNANRIVVMTDQFLSIHHAPTRNVLDYSRNLRKLGYEVLIINAAGMPRSATLALCDGTIMNFVAEYSQTNAINFEGEDYPFFQSSQEMPNVQDIQRIVDIVDDFNPRFVIEVGNGTLVAALCTYFTSVVTIPCGSGLPLFAGAYWAVARKALPQDVQMLEAFSIPSDRVFSIHYSFLEKEKPVQLVRRELQLPETAFVLCIVGNRLDEEITAEFAGQMAQIAAHVPEAYFLLIGTYTGCDVLIRQQPVLRGRMICAGQRNDIQAIYELCNAYLNPKRSGGATSGAEAMLEGLPVLTPAYGDVYYQLWLERAYENTDEMIAFIKRCIAEPDFYQEQRLRARQAGEVLFDTRAMMQELLANMDERLK